MTFKDSALKKAFKLLLQPVNRQCILLEPHLGLGDSLICIGLVRALSKRHPEKKFYYAVRYTYFHSIAWMFQDLHNIFPLAIDGEREARQFASFLNITYWPIGINNVNVQQFDLSFYKQHDVPFELRWDDSYVPPGVKSEELFSKLNPKCEPFILVSSMDSSRQTHVLKIENTPRVKIINVHAATANIFDWVKLIDYATEIHSVDTSFIHLVENCFYKKITTTKFFFHLARKNPTNFTRKLPWVNVTY